MPDITAANLGETLLGVPREVFERSAFIGQSGLAVDQDAELERRIAALITTGEEETSFSETYDRLKKQLNRRRHNKTGQIPALEREMDDLRSSLATLCDARIELFDTDGSLGAARGAALGAGLYKSSDEAFSTLERLEAVEPDREWKAPLEEAYRNWKSELEKALIP